MTGNALPDCLLIEAVFVLRADMIGCLNAAPSQWPLPHVHGRHQNERQYAWSVAYTSIGSFAKSKAVGNTP